MDPTTKTACGKLADEMIRLGVAEIRESPLSTREEQREKIHLMVQEQVEKVRAKTQRGIEAVMEGIKRLDKDHAASYTIDDKRIEALKNPENIDKVAFKEVPLQTILGYTPEMMEKMYEVAFDLFESQDLETCVQAFTFLTTLNPYWMPLWIGLGCAYEAQNKINEALISYKFGLALELGAIESYGYIGRCCLKHKRYDEGIEVMEAGMNYCKAQTKTEELETVERTLVAMRDYLQREKNLGGGR